MERLGLYFDGPTVTDWAILGRFPLERGPVRAAIAISFWNCSTYRKVVGAGGRASSYSSPRVIS
jgi:hypothetical protein